MMSSLQTLCPEYESRLSIAKKLLDEVSEKISDGILKKRNLIWLELTGCSGNIVSLLDGYHPEYEYLITNMTNLLYNNSLMSEWGEMAIAKLFNAVDTDFILAVEGAVATENNGLYNIIGRWQGKFFTALDAIKLLGERASNVISVGAWCDTWRCFRRQSQPFRQCKCAISAEKTGDKAAGMSVPSGLVFGYACTYIALWRTGT